MQFKYEPSRAVERVTELGKGPAPAARQDFVPTKGLASAAAEK
jgi:hypothetical protein